MSLTDSSLVGKYSETMVGLEILVELQWRMQTFRQVGAGGHPDPEIKGWGGL